MLNIFNLMDQNIKILDTLITKKPVVSKFTFTPEWVPNKFYAVGKVIKYANQFWTVTVAHTSLNKFNRTNFKKQ